MRTFVHLYIAFFFYMFCINSYGQSIPNYMFDVSYSNNYLFSSTNNNKINYSNGDIILKLKNDFELNAMGIFLRNFKSKHHKLYGGVGANYSQYLIERNIFDSQYHSGHFPMLYYYSPEKLNYSIHTLRFHLQICQYTFYKRVILLQKSD